LQNDDALSKPATEAITSGRGLIVDYVALRDIAVGEEIFLDYGQDWQDAWEDHVKNWQPTDDSELYTSAHQFQQERNSKETHIFLTEEEQRTNPYPDSIMTACMFGDKGNDPNLHFLDNIVYQELDVEGQDEEYKEEVDQEEEYYEEEDYDVEYEYEEEGEEAEIYYDGEEYDEEYEYNYYYYDHDDDDDDGGDSEYYDYYDYYESEDASIIEGYEHEYDEEDYHDKASYEEGGDMDEFKDIKSDWNKRSNNQPKVVTSDVPVKWSEENRNCLRPCKILDRHFLNDVYYYTVQVEQIQNYFTPNHCHLSNQIQTVLQVPESAITLVDKEYTSDQFLPTAFRHEIGIPNSLYPKNWRMQDRKPMGDFITDGLKLNQLEKIKWKTNGQIVTPNAYIMHHNPKIRETLLEYCNRMGITERFRDLTYRGNALPAEADANIQLEGLNWYIQRPSPHWKSNMHWISPLDAAAHENYLHTLSAAGFDEVLQAIGEQLGMDGLACYHLTFIGVSHCTKGYIHKDFSDSGAKVYNVMIPLLLANETGPELDLQNENDETVGRLRYNYDVASLVGDDAYHGTSAVDYRVNKEMRMVASIYVADIREDNVEAIMKDYTQKYPPENRPDILMNMAGIHWKRNDPTVTLPKPPSS
jgi:hypothetical protein